MRRFVTIVLSFVVSSLVGAQELIQDDTIESRGGSQWEKILETAVQDDNNSAAEEIIQLEENPLNLNTAPPEELHRIPALTNIIASGIIERRSHSRFTSVSELLEIEGVTPELFSFIRRFVTVARRRGESKIRADILNRTSAEIERRKGYIDGAYPGSPFKVVNRFHFSIDKIKAPLVPAVFDMDVGLLTKKDPGEFGMASSLASYAGFSIPSLRTHIIVGDYQMEAAEGLLFWRASAYGKGSDVISPARKNGGGIHPSLSSDENSFFRGIGASMGLDKIYTQVFYSNKRLNATIDDVGNISAIDKSGLFRTESERRKQNSSREVLIGCRAGSYLFGGLKIGGTYYHTRFDNPLVLVGNNGHTSSKLEMKGLDIAFTSKTVDVFSECALDYGQSLAVVGGILYAPVMEFAITMVARQYPPEFQSIHGNAFGEYSQVQNESGVYVGIKSQPIPGVCVSTYYDLFAREQPTREVPAPSHGNDFLILTEYHWREENEIAVRYKRKDSPFSTYGNDEYGRSVQHVIPRVQQNYRMNIESASSSSFHSTSRLEWLLVQYDGLQTPENGLLISQAVKWNINTSLFIQARIAVFGTDSFNSSIYEFEDEVPGTYSNPALFGRGVRWYVILRCHPISKIAVSAKYAQTVKDGVRVLGTGEDAISGNSQSTLSAQIEIQL